MASLTLADLLNDRKPIILPVIAPDGTKVGEVKATYRPSAIDLETEAASHKLRLERQTLLSWAQEMAHYLVEWDVVKNVTDDKGKVIKTELEPITVETLGRLGFSRLRDWHKAINDDMFPNTESVVTSDDGSFQ